MNTVIEVDRAECDACPAEAHVEAHLYATHPAWAGPLAFCCHHGTEYLPGLIATGAHIVDMRHEVHT